MTRRELAKLFLAVPVAGISAKTLLGAEEPSDEARFIASHEPGFSEEERTRLLKGLAEQEKSLKAVREFPLSYDVSPAMHFRPLRKP
jgi:hypothetical protein